ncbi:unnamed protein product [Calypogeia fissa]
MQGLNKLRQLDAFPKVNEDFYSRTLSGGIITIVSTVLIVALFITELHYYIHPAQETQLLVDTSRGETLNINFSIAFPKLPCSLVSLDSIDVSGQQHLNVIHGIYKRRLNSTGGVYKPPELDGVNQVRIEKPLQNHGGRLGSNEVYCGSCFGAGTSHDECCNSCEAVQKAYRKKGWALTDLTLVDQCKREGFLKQVKEQEGEGCQMFGFLEVNKVAGNFHFVPGKPFEEANLHAHEDLQVYKKDFFNVSHQIHSLSFGHHFPGKVNPLDGFERIQKSTNSMYQYFMKVVPTMYSDLNDKIVTNQFSVTEHVKDINPGADRALSGVYFYYDLSPIKVNVTHERTSFLHFLTNLCAIIGGIFTVSGIIDSVVYHGQRAVKKKIDLGKLG